MALLALTAAEFFSWFAGVGMPEYSIKEDNPSGINTAFTLSVILSLVGFVLLLMFAPIIAGWISDKNITLFVMFASYVIFTVPATFPQNLLNKALMFEKATFPPLMNDIVSVACAMFFLLIIKAGIWSLLLGQFAGFVIAGFIFWKISPVKIHWELNTDYIKRIVSYSWPLSVKNLSNIFIRRLELLAIAKFYGNANMAFYNYANNLIDNSYVLVTQITGMTLPVLSKVKDNDRELRKWYGYSVKATSAIGFPLGMFFFLFSHPLINLLYGKKWESAAPLLAVLGIGFAFRMALGESISYIAYLRGRTKFILSTSIINSAVKLVIGTWLIYIYGAIGGALYMAIVFNIIAIGSTIYMTLKEFGSLDTMWAAIPPVLASLPGAAGAFFLLTFENHLLTILAAVFFPIIYLSLLLYSDKQFRALVRELKIPVLSRIV